MNKLVGFNYNDGSSTKEYIYQRNIQGDILGIFDDKGNQVGGYVYDAYGNQTVTLDVNGIATLNPFRYRGYFYDSETQLYYLQTRYYDPEVGRFISQDDVDFINPEHINGLNLYAYCTNNPVNRYDPTGHFAISALIIGAIIGAAIGLGGTVLADYVDDGEIFNGSISAGGYIANTLVGGLIGGLTGGIASSSFTFTYPTLQFAQMTGANGLTFGAVSVGTATATISGTSVVTALD